MSRRGWEFTRLTKEIAWRQAVQNGDIPEDADPSEYQFHHRYPVEAARKRGLAQSIIRAAWNCIPLHRDDHVDLHNSGTNFDLADDVEDVPYQPGLFDEP
jgi:hypothetical protein